MLFNFKFIPSQFEEKFDEMNSVQPSMSFPLASSTGSNDNPAVETTIVGNGLENGSRIQNGQGVNSDLYNPQDISGGIMKILPSEVDVSVLIYFGNNREGDNGYLCMLKYFFMYKQDIHKSIYRDLR